MVNQFIVQIHLGDRFKRDMKSQLLLLEIAWTSIESLEKMWLYEQGMKDGLKLRIVLILAGG